MTEEQDYIDLDFDNEFDDEESAWSATINSQFGNDSVNGTKDTVKKLSSVGNENQTKVETAYQSRVHLKRAPCHISERRLPRPATTVICCSDITMARTRPIYQFRNLHPPVQKYRRCSTPLLQPVNIMRSEPELAYYHPSPMLPEFSYNIATPGSIIRSNTLLTRPNQTAQVPVPNLASPFGVRGTHFRHDFNPHKGHCDNSRRFPVPLLTVDSHSCHSFKKPLLQVKVDDNTFGLRNSIHAIRPSKLQESLVMAGNNQERHTTCEVNVQRGAESLVSEELRVEKPADLGVSSPQRPITSSVGHMSSDGKNKTSSHTSATDLNYSPIQPLRDEPNPCRRSDSSEISQQSFPLNVSPTTISFRSCSSQRITPEKKSQISRGYGVSVRGLSRGSCDEDTLVKVFGTGKVIKDSSVSDCASIEFPSEKLRQSFIERFGGKKLRGKMLFLSVP